MSSVKIVYSELKDAWLAADKAASYCEDYAAEVKRRVTKKIAAFSGTGSSYTSSAAGYAAAKIRELDNKTTKLRSYSGRLKDLYNEAKDTDQSVKTYLKLEGRDFRDSHDMHVSMIAELFVNFFISASNSNPVAKWLKDMRRKGMEWREACWAFIKYWYHCDGGKYIVKALASVVVVVLAVAAAIAALPVLISAIAAGAIGGIIVAVAGLVGAIIAAADALIDCVYNFKAFSTFQSDPAWAARYDSFNSLSGWLEKYRFTDGFLWFSASEMNAGSYWASKAVAVVKTVCAVINFCNMVKNTANFIKGYKAGANWLKTKNAYHALKKSRASRDSKALTWTEMKYMFRAFKVDYGTVTDAAKLNQFKNYVQTYDSFAKGLKAFTDGTKTLKKISKFVIKFDEKGVAKAALDFFKGETTFTKEIINDAKDVVSGIKAVA